MQEKSNFSLLVLISILMTIQLSVAARLNNFSLFSNSLLLWGGSGFLLWQKHHVLNLRSAFLSKLSGLLLVLATVLGMFLLSNNEDFLHATPLLSALGTALIASGFSGLMQYQKIFLLLCFLLPSSDNFAGSLYLSKLTILFSTFLLSQWGYSVDAQETQINLTSGDLLLNGVEITQSCSGFSAMLHLLSIAAFLVMASRLAWLESVLLSLGAIAIGFLINGVRVAILVIVRAYFPDLFQYWHQGSGSTLFTVISILLFFCLFFLLQQGLKGGSLSRD
jgi:cyanoexosortase A